MLNQINELRRQSYTVREIAKELNISTRKYYSILAEAEQAEVAAASSLISAPEVPDDWDYVVEKTVAEIDAELSEELAEELESDELEVVGFNQFTHVSGCTCTLNGAEHTFESKSSMLRYMALVGVTAKEASAWTDSHISFVYSCFKKANSRDVLKAEKRTKSDDVRDLLKTKLTISEIATKLGVSYSYVFGVAKRAGLK